MIQSQITSIESYYDLLPSLGKLQNLVLNIIKLHPCSCNREIAEYLEKPINVVTPRVKELRDKCLVVQSGFKIDIRTKKRVCCWKAKIW